MFDGLGKHKNDNGYLRGRARCVDHVREGSNGSRLHMGLVKSI